ncbi:hypothetical protein IWQ60_010739 [Tieghemiomyces parasiticus]|uniref:CBS domain-containing protein n=1 Tax=Tieghemiomyces parasiticus TaxID=78921 RepID=A0A9W7ZKB4_9FUNG|nr:hypothetical protein IWQ60_010739 [Tieghemiomyces parasiticus]
MELKPLAEGEAGAAHLRRRALIAAQPDITVGQALTLLAKYNILSLPIYSHYEPNKVVNIVNIKDILSYVTSSFQSASSAGATGGKDDVPAQWRVNLESNIEAVMTLDPARESYRVFQCEVQDKLRKTLEAFGSGIHRALVTDYNDNPHDPKPDFLLTQSDVVRYVHDHPGCLNTDLLETTVEQLFPKAIHKKLFTVREDEPVLRAYALMDQEDRSAAAVLDSEGRIVGNLSASDLRGLTEDNLTSLMAPVKVFLAHLHSERGSVVTCKADDTLQILLDQVCSHAIHRSWVVDENCRPVGVITLTDIIALLNQ